MYIPHFRGKARMSIEELDDRSMPHENGWVFGAYLEGYILTGLRRHDHGFIIPGEYQPPSPGQVCAVIPETVGLSSGEFDRDRNLIYSGDTLAQAMPDGTYANHAVVHYGPYREAVEHFEYWGNGFYVIGDRGRIRGELTKMLELEAYVVIDTQEA